MHFDLPTLLAADSFVTAMSGAILILIALQSRDARGILWWGLGNMCVAAGTGIFAIKGGLPDLGWRIAVATFINLAGGCYWTAARSCRRRDVPNWLGILAGPVLWLSGLAIPVVQRSPELQMSLATGIGALYTAAAAFEMWRGRSERLTARWPLFAILLFDVAVSAAGAIESFLEELTPLTLPPMSAWYGLVYFDTFLLAVGGAIFIVLLARERAEQIQRTAAHLDVLTGIANRRAFMDHAEASLGECLHTDTPLSLIFFDLDHFKAINDIHGHATGDRVIAAFAAVARGFLRSEDTIGRIGGEEFAVVLPGLGPGTAFVIADRIRLAFADQCRTLDDVALGATVSGGIATAGPSSTLQNLIQAGDEALYRAKAAGRNRVERASPTGLLSKPATVIRVA